MHPIEKLTALEYNAIMQAINNAKNAVLTDDFIDPYAENPDNWTNDHIYDALTSVEKKIITAGYDDGTNNA